MWSWPLIGCGAEAGRACVDGSAGKAGRDGVRRAQQESGRGGVERGWAVALREEIAVSLDHLGLYWTRWVGKDFVCVGVRR